MHGRYTLSHLDRDECHGSVNLSVASQIVYANNIILDNEKTKEDGYTFVFTVIRSATNLISGSHTSIFRFDLID